MIVGCETLDLLAARWLDEENRKFCDGPKGAAEEQERQANAQFTLDVLIGIMQAATVGNIAAVKWLEDRGFISLPKRSETAGEVRDSRRGPGKRLGGYMMISERERCNPKEVFEELVHSIEQIHKSINGISS